MASGLTQKAKYGIIYGSGATGGDIIDLLNNTIKVMLVDSTYTFDPDVDFVDDGSANDAASKEIAVSGYTGGFNGAGRKTLANKALTEDATNNRMEFDNTVDLTWSTLGSGVTIGGVVFIKEITNDAASIVIGFDELTSNVATNGGDITYVPSNEGIFHF